MTATVQEQSLEVLTKSATETYGGSVLLMKQLTTIAISAVTYIKNVFEEENFKIEHINGLKINILKKNCKNELAQFLSTALTQAFDAFDKKYLQKLALCFYDGDASDADKLIEYVVFEYSYTQSGMTMDVRSKSQPGGGGGRGARSQFTVEHVRNAITIMLRRCISIIKIQFHLPASYDISLRLYYNDAAPEGYQPPGFIPVSEVDDHLEMCVIKNGHLDQMGCVQTPFHRIVGHYCARQVLPSSNTVEPSQNAPLMTQDDLDDYDTNVSVQDSAGQAASSAGRGAVRCPCLKEDFDGELMLTCDICGYLQHGACFGRVRAPHRHACVSCAPAPGADLKLMRLSEMKRECMCVLRRSLYYCSRRVRVAPCELQHCFQLSDAQTDKLLRQLITLRVLEDSEHGIMQPRKIFHEELKAQIRRTFYEEESELVERLEAEGFSEAPCDPVGAVLGPTERAILQDATVLGKMIEPPTQKVVEDKTLQQYKEALRSDQNMEEDLPLSGNHNPVQDMNLIGRKRRTRNSNKENTNSVGVKNKRVKSK